MLSRRQLRPVAVLLLLLSGLSPLWLSARECLDGTPCYMLEPRRPALADSGECDPAEHKVQHDAACCSETGAKPEQPPSRSSVCVIKAFDFSSPSSRRAVERPQSVQWIAILSAFPEILSGEPQPVISEPVFRRADAPSQSVSARGPPAFIA